MRRARERLHFRGRTVGPPPQGVPRLGIPAFNYWTEAQHGVGVTAGINTVPQPASSCPNTNTLAAAWSPSAFTRAAAMAATEARGRHNSAVHYGHRTDNQVC